MQTRSLKFAPLGAGFTLMFIFYNLKNKFGQICARIIRGVIVHPIYRMLLLELNFCAILCSENHNHESYHNRDNSNVNTSK